jgi:sarcosine oxidase subunit gamma
VASFAQISLRGSSAAFLDACEAVLGLRPPTEANTAASLGQKTILWLGPDEWLLVGEAGGEAAMVQRLRKALEGIHSAVVDLSASRALLWVSGPHAEETLAKAATLDFHVRAFPVGHCAQTNIARTQGIIHRTGPEEFRIFVRTSFARYLSAWLSDANGIK